MEDGPTFLCDAMLGGLARWLRAAGYRAPFNPHITDGELVRRAHDEGLVLLTSDSGVLQRFAVSEGLVRHVFVPRGLSVAEQLGCVLAALKLPLREPRCMDCGGALPEVPLEAVREQVPPKVRECCSGFYRCDGCCKVYWRGTHWKSIRECLARAEALSRGRPG